MNPLLEIRNLSVAYGKVEALHRSNLVVDQGGIVTVIGPNGAGKSTLVNAIMGLLPADGEVNYAGKAIRDLSVEARVAQGLCLVPERLELFAELSVSDNLALGAYSRYARGERRFGEDLEAIYRHFPGLRERRHQAAAVLSGGERQMLALGRALMAKPRLLMLDEPSLGLGPLVVREIFRIISDLRQSGVSVLLIEQNARAALQIADFGYVLEAGEVVLEGEAAALAMNARVVETYLGFNRSGR